MQTLKHRGDTAIVTFNNNTQVFFYKGKAVAGWRNTLGYFQVASKELSRKELAKILEYAGTLPSCEVTQGFLNNIVANNGE